MPNSIDFYKGISLYVIPVRVIVPCYYKIWKKEKKSNRFNRLEIEVFFLPNISPLPIISPLNLPFIRIYARGVLTGFYSIFLPKSCRKCVRETSSKLFIKKVYMK